MDGDKVESITLITGGNQYASAPTITIDAPDSGTTATATASLEPIYYTVASSTETISGISTIALENLNNDIGAGTTAYFHQVVGSLPVLIHLNILVLETQFNLPPQKRWCDYRANEVFTDDGGRVVYTSTDQAGNFESETTYN